MKKVLFMTIGGLLAGSLYANTTTMPSDSKTEASAESKVDTSKNIFTGTKTVTTTNEKTYEAKPGMKVKKYSKNIKKYDKEGNLIKNENKSDNETITK